MKPAAGEVFTATERRIAVVGSRLSGYPRQLVTLMRLTVHIQKRMQQDYNRALKRHGLNFVTYNALMMIYGSDEERLRVSELAATTGEKATNITRICDDLVDKGLIRRVADPRDRRAIVLLLSARGRRLIETVLPQMWGLLEQFYAPFTQPQRDALEQLLRAQLGALETQTQ